MSECPGSGQLPTEIIEALDLDDKGICPSCGLRCGLMLNEDIGKEVIKPHSKSDTWRVYVEVKDTERDEAMAFAQGAANMLGLKASLIRVDHGDEIHVADYKPKKR